MQKISVVVPVYNVEKYLKRCVDSILHQSYRQLEVILVDDGSTDNSGNICDEYKLSDERIIVIHKENGGLSSARNAGMEMASGAYICFIDSDDYIDYDMIKILLDDILRWQSDMAVCGVYNVYQEQKKPQCERREQFVCSGEKAYELLLIGEKIPGTICNKLIRKDILADIRFPEGKHYEDAFFHIKLMPRLKYVSVNTTPLYYYIHREGSITTEKFDSRGMDIIQAYEQNYRAVVENYPTLKEVAEFRVQWAYFVVLDRMMQCERYWRIPEYKRVKDKLKRDALHIVGSPYFRKARKVGAFALKINIKLYYLLTMINRNKRGNLA